MKSAWVVAVRLLVSMVCAIGVVPGVVDAAPWEATGTNFIRDKLLGGNEALYNGLSLATAAIGLVGPGGAAKLTGHADDVVGAVNGLNKLDNAAEAVTTGNKAGNAAEVATAGGRASDAATTSSASSKVEQVAGACGARSFTTSKPGATTSSGTPYRIDVENPNPGQRPGQLHIQIGPKGKVDKYLYDFDAQEFVGVSAKLQKTLVNDPNIAAAIAKGMRVLGLS